MTDKTFFGPLTLNDKEAEPTVLKITEPQDVPCLLCDENFILPDQEKDLLTHFFMKHRLVIADVNLIADLKSYVTYWKVKLLEAPLEEYCTTMLLNEQPDGTKSENEKYYLLSDVLPQDKELRCQLQQARLESLLIQHQLEREDSNFVRECLFCRHQSKDTRAGYLKHLYEKHNFHIAKPDNLIFVDNLIEKLSNTLESLKCIYCEKIFKDRNVLKEHMRKKGHKRINPSNKAYDKYFLSNYLDAGKLHYQQKIKNYQHKNARRPQNEYDSEVESDPEWSDWTEKDSPKICCLFCVHKDSEHKNILKHLLEIHLFNFNNITNGLSFYQKVKVVNYIRRQVHHKQCIACNLTFDETVNLERHIREAKHSTIDRMLWDQPEFYFPTYEDDLFLCFVEDEDESWWSSDELAAENDDRNTDRISKEMADAVLND